MMIAGCIPDFVFDTSLPVLPRLVNELTRISQLSSWEVLIWFCKLKLHRY